MLLVGNYRPSISVVRSLGPLGYRIITGREAAWTSYVERSKHVDEVWDHPSIEHEPDRFDDALVRFLADRPDVRFVFPLRGLALMAICRCIGRLPEHVVPVMPAPEVVGICDDKPRMIELVASIGVPYPRSAVISDTEALRAQADAIGYPCIVKPTVAEERVDGEKAVIFSRPADLRERVRAWLERSGSLLLQAYVPGPRYNMHFAARDGEVLCHLGAVVLRTQRLDGTGLAIEGLSVALPGGMAAHGRRLIEALRYTGVGCLQFLYDRREGSAYFLECNPRLGASYAICHRCGLDLPRLAVDIAAGRPVPGDLGAPLAIGRRFAWTEGDLSGLRKALARRDVGPVGAARWLGRAALSFARTDMHITWSRRDPRPTLSAYGSALRDALPVPKRRPRAPSG